MLPFLRLAPDWGTYAADLRPRVRGGAISASAGNVLLAVQLPPHSHRQGTLPGQGRNSAEQGESDSGDFGMSLRYFVRC